MHVLIRGAMHGLAWGYPMTEKPPSDPAEHAQDFSRRYTDDLDIVAGQAMLGLGLTNDQMGALDHERGSEHHCFFPQDPIGGSVNTAGQVTLDSGLMNPELLAEFYDQAAQEQWKKTRLRDRAQAIIAHELAEAECKDHELALTAGPETKLPISHEAKELLRKMEAGWRGR
jgi:hypothetical protein